MTFLVQPSFFAADEPHDERYPMGADEAEQRRINAKRSSAREGYRAAASEREEEREEEEEEEGQKEHVSAAEDGFASYEQEKTMAQAREEWGIAPPPWATAKSTKAAL